MATTGTLHGQMLIQHKRFKEAEDALRHQIAGNPQDGSAHTLLALALAGQGRFADGLAEARQGVGLRPDSAFATFVDAYILHQMDRDDEALSTIERAIQMDPNQSHQYELLGKIFIAKRDWNKALEAARAGRALDPEDEDIANLEAFTLTQLGRKDEAGQAIVSALSRDPENAMTHANLGWNLLHQGQPEQAMIHFREALRINPNHEWARLGIVEAMKARNPIYKVILGYFLWMGRLSSRTQWALMIGLYVLFQFVRGVARSNPELSPFLMPLIWIYIAFAIMTWISQPLFNLLLRLDQFGRMALSPEQIHASSWFGACLLAAVTALAIGLAFNSGTLLVGALGAFAMSLPVSGVFRAPTQKKRTFLAIYAALLALSGLVGLAFTLLEIPSGIICGSIFILGWVAYSWVANAIIHSR